MRLLYQLFIKAYPKLIAFWANFNPKAKQWIDGRKQPWPIIPHSSQPLAWVHCASLGEFEQAKPIIEALHQEGIRILLSFFSPSGYSQAQHYPLAEAVVYLPMDSRQNALLWYQHFKPNLVIFVKYEFWYYYLQRAHQLQIPLFLISARFRSNQLFFKPYGGFYKKLLSFYQLIFTQDDASLQLLHKHGYSKVVRSGDTRFDRVLKLKKKAALHPLIAEFAKNSEVIVAGSSWPEEESIVAEAYPHFDCYKWIIVPHDIAEKNIKRLQSVWGQKAITLSLLKAGKPLTGQTVLIVDAIGFLGGTYSLAKLALVGGGFKNALHNILEAAVWGIPVCYGSYTHKFPEAKNLEKAGGGKQLVGAAHFIQFLKELHQNPDLHHQMSMASALWVQQNVGATALAMPHLLKALKPNK